jgi:chaperonin GroEL
MKKEIYFDEELRKKWLAGAEKIAKAVGSTMGPCGRFFAMAGMRAPVITKDGVSVAKDIDLVDPVENSGARLMREVALRTNDTAGDGTTTSIVLAYELVREGYKAVEAGCIPIELKRGMDKALKGIIAEIKKESVPVKKEDIEKVATISANNDEELGKLTAKAVEIAGAGADSIVNVEATKGIDTNIEETSGLTFGSGWASSYFVNNKERNEVNFDNALILLTDKKIMRLDEITPYLEASIEQKKPLLIVCESLEGEALNVVVLNLLSGNINVAAVKCPGYGQSKLDWLEDISTMTGATLITDATGANLEDCGAGFLGEAKTVIVTKSETSIIGGFGDEKNIEKYVKTLEEQRKNAEEGREKEKLDERIARFKGSAATIKVGASTDVEAKEIKDRLTDAVCAVKAALKEGVSPGGGVNFINRHYDSTGYTEDMKRGAEILLKAMKKPLKQIAENAGLNGDVVLNNCFASGKAYNARTEEYGDPFEMGLIEPTLVQTEALANAVSVAGTMLATNGANVRIDEDKES